MLRCKFVARAVGVGLVLSVTLLVGCQEDSAKPDAPSREQRLEDDKARQSRELDEVRNPG